MCKALTTPLPVDGHAPHANLRRQTTNQRSKLVHERSSLPLHGDLRNFKSIRTAIVGEKLACQTEGFSTGDLGFDNFGVSHTGLLAICIVAD